MGVVASPGTQWSRIRRTCDQGIQWRIRHSVGGTGHARGYTVCVLGGDVMVSRVYLEFKRFNIDISKR